MNSLDDEELVYNKSLVAFCFLLRQRCCGDDGFLTALTAPDLLFYVDSCTLLGLSETWIFLNLIVILFYYVVADVREDKSSDFRCID